MKILEEFWYGNIEPTDYDTSPSSYDGRTENIVREIHGLCPRTSNHYGVPDIPEQL